jgi:hypothetical protein
VTDAGAPPNSCLAGSSTRPNKPWNCPLRPTVHHFQ